MKNWQAVLGVAATATLLTACGGGFAEESPKSILDAAEKDMKALESVRLEGDLTSDGEDIAFDMAVSTDGDCDGTFEIAGGSAQIRSVGGESWMKPDDAFWDSFAGDSAELVKGVVGDKWVVMPQEDADFTQFCDLDELLADLGEDDEEAAKAESKGTEDVDGDEAVKIATETDEGDPMTAWVAVDDPHHILKMEVTEGEEPGVITFSDFDKKLEVEAPAEDEVVDLNQLGS